NQCSSISLTPSYRRQAVTAPRGKWLETIAYPARLIKVSALGGRLGVRKKYMCYERRKTAYILLRSRSNRGALIILSGWFFRFQLCWSDYRRICVHTKKGTTPLAWPSGKKGLCHRLQSKR